MIKSIKKLRGRGGGGEAPRQKSVSMPLPRAPDGSSVDVERLYGASPEQLRSAAESYSAESRRLLDSVVEGRKRGSRSSKKFLSPEEMEASTARAFEYASESRRLIDKAVELEKKLGRDPNDPKRVAYDVYQGVNSGKLSPEEARIAVRVAEKAARTKEIAARTKGMGELWRSGGASLGVARGGGGGPVDADEYLEQLNAGRGWCGSLAASVGGPCVPHRPG